MKSLFRCVSLTAVLFSALFIGGSQQLFAQEHVVSPGAIQQQLVTSAAQRQQNIDTLHRFFGSALAQKTLKSAGMSSEQVTNAVSKLSDSELAQLASKADHAQKDFAAGALTNQQITYILIALATAVIVILIVKA